MVGDFQGWPCFPNGAADWGISTQIRGHVGRAPCDQCIPECHIAAELAELVEVQAIVLGEQAICTPTFLAFALLVHSCFVEEFLDNGCGDALLSNILHQLHRHLVDALAEFGCEASLEIAASCSIWRDALDRILVKRVEVHSTAHIDYACGL